MCGLFAVCYGAFRFFVEFFREPDAHIGYLAFDWLTMGQLLCIPMILLGATFIWWAYRKKEQAVKQYLDLMRLVRENGTYKSDRTGTGTWSVFGRCGLIWPTASAGDHQEMPSSDPSCMSCCGSCRAIPISAT